VPDVDSYDILVLGSGESGKYLAWTMAGAGHRTAVVEQKLIGGSCPNVACLPSKNIIHSAKVKSLQTIVTSNQPGSSAGFVTALPVSRRVAALDRYIEKEAPTFGACPLCKSNAHK